MIEEQAPKGPIEGMSRILRELLRTPRFKASVRIILRDLDPENAALLVRTLVWEDPEFFLSLVGSTPALLNAAIAGADEATAQLANFPPVLLTGFMAGLIEEIDARRLGHAAGQALVLSARLAAVNDEKLMHAASNFWEGLGAGITESLPGAEAGEGAVGLLLDTLVPMLGAAVERLGAEAVREGSEARRLVAGIAESVRQIAGENPEFMQEVAVPLVDAGREALAAAESGGAAGEEEDGGSE
ncbi:MAG TPA: hypothetical protein VIK15_01030 [Candidatus Anoxymicrobiaceae bacterium]